MALHIPDIPDDLIPDAYFKNGVYRAAEHAKIGLERDRGIQRRQKVKGFTIDSPHTPDIDDAIWMETLPNGDLKVDVSISDVSYAVKPGSVLDAEALTRVETFYRGRRSNPMLPPLLSEDALSLKGSFIRPTMTISIILGPALEVKEVTHRRTQLFNAMRLSFSDVDTYAEKPREEQPSRIPSVSEMYNLALRLYTQRTATEVLTAEHACEGDLDEVLAKPYDHTDTREKPGQLIVQELMLLANRVTAEKLADVRAPTLYRVKKRDGIAHYSHEPEAHAHLGFDVYTHCTSPIRRYSDIVVHRAIASALLGEKDDETLNRRELEELAAYLNRRIAGVEGSRGFNKRPGGYASLSEERLSTFTPAQFVEMREDHFSELVEYCSRNQRGSTSFFEGIEEKIRQRTLDTKSMLIILSEVNSANIQWKNSAEKILELFSVEPHRATMLMMHAQNIGFIETAEYCEESQGEKFACYIRARRKGEDATSSLRAVATNKQEAKNRAAALWFTDFVQGTLTTEPRADALVINENHHAKLPAADALARLADRLKVAKPEYTAREIVISRRNSEWEVTGRLTTHSGVEFMATARHSSSKEARHIVAREILRQLEELSR